MKESDRNFHPKKKEETVYDETRQYNLRRVLPLRWIRYLKLSVDDIRYQMFCTTTAATSPIAMSRAACTSSLRTSESASIPFSLSS